MSLVLRWRLRKKSRNHRPTEVESDGVCCCAPNQQGPPRTAGDRLALREILEVRQVCDHRPPSSGKPLADHLLANPHICREVVRWVELKGRCCVHCCAPDRRRLPGKTFARIARNTRALMIDGSITAVAEVFSRWLQAAGGIEAPLRDVSHASAAASG